MGKGLRINLQNSIHMFAISAKNIEHCMGKGLEEYISKHSVISLGDEVGDFYFLLFVCVCFFLVF